jgi:hypothetical protein
VTRYGLTNLRLRAPHPDALTLFTRRQEFDASFGQGLLNRFYSAYARIHLSLFQTGDRVQGHNGFVGKLLLGPAQKRSGGPNLSWGDHGHPASTGVEKSATIRLLLCL